MAAARARGRDWSSYQRPVTKANVAGLAFGICRVSDWGSWPAIGTDRTFRQDWAQIRALGLQRGAYWYLMPSGGPSAQQQAAAFAHEVMQAGLARQDWLVVDAEEDAPGIDDFTLAFLDELHTLLPDHPVAFLMVYTNGYIGSKLVATSRKYQALWFAWPPSAPGQEPGPAHWAPAEWPGWRLWQNAITRQPDGEMVDADLYSGSAKEMHAWIASVLGTPAGGPAAGLMEEPMLLNKGAGAITPVALRDGVTKVRIYASAKPEDGVEVHINLRNGKPVTKLELNSSSAHTVVIPHGVRAIDAVRVDGGDHDVSLVEAA